MSILAALFGLVAAATAPAGAPTALASAAPASAPCSYAAGADTVRVDGRPFAATPSADGCWVFVSLVGDAGGRNGVAVLQNEGGRFRWVRTVPIGADATGLAITHDGRQLVVAAQDAVVVLDVAKLQAGGDPFVGRIPEGAGAGTVYVATTPDDRLLFASDERANRITVSDLALGRVQGFGPKVVIGRIAQGSAPVGLAVSGDGSRLYATSESTPPAMGYPRRCRAEKDDNGRMHPEGVLSVIDTATAARTPAKALLTLVPVGCNPVRVALGPDGASAWVTARGEDAVYRIDTAALERSGGETTRGRIEAGASPVGIVFDREGRLWVSDSDRFGGGAGVVRALSQSGQILRTVKTGGFPRDLRLLPDGAAVVVAVFEGRAVQFIPTAGP